MEIIVKVSAFWSNPKRSTYAQAYKKHPFPQTLPSAYCQISNHRNHYHGSTVQRFKKRTLTPFPNRVRFVRL